MKVYELAYSWYEDYTPYLFFSEKEYTLEEWEKVCDDLLPLAVDFALDKAFNVMEDGEVYVTWIGWDSIVEQMSILLLNRGFERIQTFKKTYWGSIIIDNECDDDDKRLSPEYLKKLIDHNLAVRNGMNNDVEEGD